MTLSPDTSPYTQFFISNRLSSFILILEHLLSAIVFFGHPSFAPKHVHAHWCINRSASVFFCSSNADNTFAMQSSDNGPSEWFTESDPSRTLLGRWVPFFLFRPTNGLFTEINKLDIRSMSLLLDFAPQDSISQPLSKVLCQNTIGVIDRARIFPSQYLKEL